MDVAGDDLYEEQVADDELEVSGDGDDNGEDSSLEVGVQLRGDSGSCPELSRTSFKKMHI